MWSTYTNKIDQILNNNSDRNSESTLNELLQNQEDLISEIKRCNPKLLDYFRDNQKMVLTLVEYISVESDDLSNIDRCFKYPLVSSDLFDCSPACIMTQFFVESKDPSSVTKKIANCQSIKPNSGDQDDDCNDGDTSRDVSAADAHDQNKDQDGNNEQVKKSGSKQKVFEWPIMNKLFEFLKPLTHINEVLAGYWSKVVQSLISMKPQEMIEYILTSKGVLEGLFRHINNQSIASIVQSLLILESNKFSSQTQEFLKDFTEIKVKAIGEFIKKFESYQAEEIQNLSLIFSEIIQKYYLIQDGKEMLEYLCNEESVEQLFNYIKNGSDGSKIGAGQIIQSLGQYYAFNANSFINGYPEGSEYYQIMLQQYENMPYLKTLMKNFEAFCEILSIKDNRAAGGRETLGIHRLKIIEIITQVIKIQFPSVQEAVVNTKLLQYILDLFFKFEWHNILHQTVLTILLFIIQNNDKPKIRLYLKHLLCDLKITEQLIQQVGDTQYYFDKIKYPNRATTKGYLGYVIKISDELEKFYQNSNNTRSNSDMLDWHNQAWINFRENTLDIHKEKGCKDLGNFDKYINGKIAAEQTAGEDDMAIYREYERQQAAERMKARQNYQEQVEMQKYYEQKKTKDQDTGTIVPDYTPFSGDKKTTGETFMQPNQTPTGEAQPNSIQGVSQIRSSSESLSAQKQNIVFVQMDSKKLDDDVQMEEDDDELKRNQSQNKNIGLSETNTSTPSFYNTYISDNPLIREIMEKYSPQKPLVTKQDTGSAIPPTQLEDRYQIVNLNQNINENFQVITEKKTTESQEVKNDQAKTQIQKEGVNQNIYAQEQDQQNSSADLKSVSHVAEDGEDAIEEESSQKQLVGQTVKNEILVSSASNLDIPTRNNDFDYNQFHSLTELGKEVDQNKSNQFSQSIKKTFKEQEGDQNKTQQFENNQNQQVQQISNSPDKINSSQTEKSKIDDNKDEKVLENTQVSDRQNYFVSSVSSAIGERNKSTEDTPNRLLQKKPSFSHSPTSHSQENQTQSVSNKINSQTLIQNNLSSSKLEEQDKQRQDIEKNSEVQEYQYVLLNKKQNEERNSSLIEQFEQNVQSKKTSLLNSQDLSKNSNASGVINATQNNTKPETEGQNDESLPKNVIKVEKSEFKNFVLSEEPSNFEPINIEQERNYDKDEKAQILESSSKNTSPTGQDIQQQTSVIGSMEPLSNFKYEMKYTTSDNKQNDSNKKVGNVSSSNMVEQKQDISEEGKLPVLVYEDKDPIINAAKKKFGQEDENIPYNQSKSLPTDAFRKSDEYITSYLYPQTADSVKMVGSSPMKFKQQFQENLRASYDTSTSQSQNNQQNQNINLETSNQPIDLKLSNPGSNDSSPNSLKIYKSQSQEERMQIQQLLLQKYSKGSSNNSSPSSNQNIIPSATINPIHLTPTETKPVDFASTSSAHQHYSYNIHGHSHDSSQLNQQNSVNPPPALKSSTSQNEKMSFVQQETELLEQKLSSSRDYQLLQNQIRDMQNVYEIINDDNTVLIEQRIITSEVSRQSFFDLSEKNRMLLEVTIDGLEDEKQREEKELKLQYQTEFEMIEKQMKQEQDETKAKKKTEDFLQKLLVDRVNKIYEIHLKYSIQQKQSLEKAILEAKNLNEKLHSMNLLVAPAKQLSPEKPSQILNIEGNTLPIVSSNIQSINPVPLSQDPNNQNIYSTKNQDDIDLQKYLVTSNPVMRQYNSLQSTNQSEAENSNKTTTNKKDLTVETFKKLSNQEDGTNSPCFGDKDPLRIPMHRPSEDSVSSGGDDQQKHMNQSQGAEASPCFGSKRSPTRKGSFSQRYSQRKMSGTQQTEAEVKEPYDYKASSSARDKSPMPSQAAMYHSNSSSASQISNPGASTDYLRRLTQNTTLASNQQPYRQQNSIQQQPQQSYPIVQQTSMQTQLQQQNQQPHQHRRIFENYGPQSNNPYKTSEEQMNLSANSNSSNQKVYYYDSQGQLISQTNLSQDYSQQQNVHQNPQQHQKYHKIFSQTPMQALKPQNLPQSNQQMPMQQQMLSSGQLQQQQQIQQGQAPYLNYNYNQSQQQMKQPEDQYKKISDNLKLSGYYNQPQVKTIQIDLSKDDDRKVSDYVSSGTKSTSEQPIRANQSAIYTHQKQISQPFHQQRSSYGQIYSQGNDQQEIENSIQFRQYVQQNKSNTPGNGNTPIGSSQNLNQLQQQSSQKELNHKMLSQTTFVDNNPRHRPLSQSDIMFKTPQGQIISESQHGKLSSTHSNSPQTNQNYQQIQYNPQNYQHQASKQQQQQQFSQNPPHSQIHDILAPDVKQIIEKYTTGTAQFYHQNQPMQQQYGQQPYGMQPQQYQQVKGYNDDQYGSIEKMKNSSTNYSNYSGNGSSYYMPTGGNHELSSQSDMNEESSINSSINSSQFMEGLGGKKIKIVMRKSNQPQAPVVNDQSEYMRQQQLNSARSQQQKMDMNQQQLNSARSQQSQMEMNQQQPLTQSHSASNIKQARQIQERDKQFLGFIRPSKNN